MVAAVSYRAQCPGQPVQTYVPRLDGQDLGVYRLADGEAVTYAVMPGRHWLGYYVAGWATDPGYGAPVLVHGGAMIVMMSCVSP